MRPENVIFRPLRADRSRGRRGPCGAAWDREILSEPSISRVNTDIEIHLILSTKNMASTEPLPTPNPSFLRNMSATSLFNALGIPGSYCSPPQVIIDCRYPSEYAERHIRGAINLPVSQVEDAARLLNGYAAAPRAFVPNIPHLPPAKKALTRESKIRELYDPSLAAAAPSELAERIYNFMWERFSKSYNHGCDDVANLTFYFFTVFFGTGWDGLGVMTFTVRTAGKSEGDMRYRWPSCFGMYVDFQK
eukprot:1389418-Amorphochlora_amoeboformis.AAC.1